MDISKIIKENSNVFIESDKRTNEAFSISLNSKASGKYDVLIITCFLDEHPPRIYLLNYLCDDRVEKPYSDGRKIADVEYVEIKNDLMDDVKTNVDLKTFIEGYVKEAFKDNQTKLEKVLKNLEIGFGKIDGHSIAKNNQLAEKSILDKYAETKAGNKKYVFRDEHVSSTTGFSNEYLDSGYIDISTIANETGANTKAKIDKLIDSLNSGTKIYVWHNRTRRTFSVKQ